MNDSLRDLISEIETSILPLSRINPASPLQVVNGRIQYEGKNIADHEQAVLLCMFIPTLTEPRYDIAALVEAELNSYLINCFSTKPLIFHFPDSDSYVQ